MEAPPRIRSTQVHDAERLVLRPHVAPGLQASSSSEFCKRDPGRTTYTKVGASRTPEHIKRNAEALDAVSVYGRAPKLRESEITATAVANAILGREFV